MSAPNAGRRYRYAPEDWRPSRTVVRYSADDNTGLLGRIGVFVGNPQPQPDLSPAWWPGVLVQFDGERAPLDVDPADLEVMDLADLLRSDLVDDPRRRRLLRLMSPAQRYEEQ